MATPPFSTRIFVGLITPVNTRVLLGTVPSGYRVVVRSLSVLQTPGTAVFFDLYLATGGPLVHRVLTADANSAVLQDARFVFHEGEQIYGYARTNTAQVSLHGYLLRGAGAPMVPGALPA